MILPVALYRCESCSPTLREAHTECSEELHNLYAPPYIIRETKSRKVMGGARSTHWRGEKFKQNLVG